IVRRAPRFRHTFAAVKSAYPAGIEARASIWVWRRMLEVLSFLHLSGVVHGALLPSHLLVEEGEHGVLVVGYGCADRPGARLRRVEAGFESFYPERAIRERTLSVVDDLAMSARCLAFLLGLDVQKRVAAAAIPPALAEIVSQVGRG